MLKNVGQFFKIRVVFHTFSLEAETKSVTPIVFFVVVFFFFAFLTQNNSVSDCSKNLKKFYRLENFRANGLKFDDIMIFFVLPGLATCPPC